MTASLIGNNMLVRQVGLDYIIQFEPRHDKINVMRLRPAWIQTSLRNLQIDENC
jgi:hypothetical protein